MRLSVIIAAYNEENTVREIVTRVRAVPLDIEIVAVNDCSSDRTGEVLEALKAEQLVHVVEQRRRPREALVADQLLGQQRAVAAKHRVPLVRQLPERVVDRHYKFPLSACSRSMASNSALKLPFPNPLLPLRWISSKNTVGRSSTGRVNNCSR